MKNFMPRHAVRPYGFVFALLFGAIVASLLAVPAAARAGDAAYVPDPNATREEVPVRYKDMALYDQVMRDWQTYYNAEPFWGTVCSIDLEAIARQAGFETIRAGYVKVSNDPIKEPRTFVSTPSSANDHRFILSAVK